MLKYLRERPMFLAAGLCAVLSVCLYYGQKRGITIAICAIVIVIALIYLKLNVRSLIIALLLIIATLNILFNLNTIKTLNKLSGDTVFGEFKVLENSKTSGEYFVTTVESLSCEKFSDKIKITMLNKNYEFKAGDIIEAELRLSEITGQYKLNFYSKGIYLRGYCKNLILSNKSDRLLKFSLMARKYIISTLFSRLSNKSAATVCALTCGDRSYMADEFYGAVKSAGVSHVLVVSGMHLAIIMSFIIKVSERFIYNVYLRAVLVIFTVFFLAVICGFTVSILRAGITYIIAAFAPILRRDNSPANSLGLAVCIMIISSPFIVFDLVFRLSVLSTFGVIAVAPEIAAYFNIKNKFLKYIAESSVITLSAMVMTMPDVVYTYKYISTVAVITNLLISYAATLALIISVLVLVISLIFPIVTVPLFFILEIVTRYINAVIYYFGSLRFAKVNVDKRFTLAFILIIFAVMCILSACKWYKGMLKSNRITDKIISEGGEKVKWR
ncbi:MAG: ComEC/Rec2 family competence protein [Clostridia bacterium]|nr:ComEC/Rec2 family competence protein [Clostridia bacterium]